MMENPEVNDTGIASNRKARLLELLVFLFLILPSMVFSFTMIGQGQTPFAISAGATILRDLSLLSLVLFLLWRNREPVAVIGWRWNTKPLFEILIGLVLFPAVFFFLGWIEQLLSSIGVSAPSAAASDFVPTGVAQTVLAVVLLIVVAVTEETIFRGYLFVRIDSFTRNTATAVVLSAVVFSIGHGYEGLIGVANAAALGILLELLFLWRRSLIAPMVIHFLQDFLAILILPHLVKGG